MDSRTLDLTGPDFYIRWFSLQMTPVKIASRKGSDEAIQSLSEDRDIVWLCCAALAILTVLAVLAATR